MLILLNLLVVQIVLLLPLAGGSLWVTDSWAWDVWGLYFPMVSSGALVGTVFGQRIFSMRFSKATQILLFAAVVALLTGLGVWGHHAFQSQSLANSLNWGYLQAIEQSFGPLRLGLLLASTFSVSLLWAIWTFRRY